MADRPNKKALDEALDLYRDAMRPFIVRHLKKVRGQTVEECVKTALRDFQVSRFEQNIRDGRAVQSAIDVNDFLPIVHTYWRDVFHTAFKSSGQIRDSLHAIAEARNKAAHPSDQDMPLGYTLASLSDIIEVLKIINDPGGSRVVQDIRNELTPFSTPAHKFSQGGRDVYAFTVDLATLDNLLPDRVDDAVVKDANRPLTRSHAKNIQRYLEERNDWLLGTILLGITPDAVEFQSYTPDVDTGNAVGLLTINNNGVASMKMFDGQHRRRAIKDVLRELSHSPKNTNRLASLRTESLPVMLYVESKIEALRQMFADASRTKPVEGNTIARFDQHDPFNVVALQIAEQSDLFIGRVEMERASISRSSQNIIAINQLAATLKTLEVGYKGRVSQSRNDSYMLDLEPLYERCLLWADDFMPSARNEYNALMNGDIDNSDIPQERTRTMAYNATVIRILAGCYHSWVKDSSEWKPLAEFLRVASLQTGSTAGSLLVDAGVVTPGSITPHVQVNLVVRAIEYIVQRAKEQSGKV